ncbi:diacylglycerol/lipid kinase family protein [Acidobacteriota bacterium]
MDKEIALIFNPSAGRGKANRKRKKVEACLKAQHIPYEIFVTRSESHLVEIAAQVVQKFPVIVGAGGDTTLTIIAQQIFRYKKGNTLGVISLGSVNDLAREIGVHKIEHACRAIKRGRSIFLDVGVLKRGIQEDPFFFLGQASIGLGVEVNRYVEIWMEKHSFMSRFNSMAQGVAAVGGFYNSYKRKIVPLNVDLKQTEGTTSLFSPFIIFTNTSINAREFRLSPFASPVDGLLDCCIVNASTFPNFVNALIHVKRQTHLETNKVEIIQDKYFKIYAPHPIEIQADGEIFQSNGEIEISVLPRALQVIVNPESLHWMQ